MLLNSLKTNMDFFKDIWSLPEKPLLSNYVNVWDQMNLLVYFGNSIKLTLLGTLASILTASMASYVIAKYKFKLSKLLYTMAIVVMLIPSIGTIAALYKFMISTHLFNTHLGLVLLYSGGFGFNFILLYGFFKSVSWSYAEAGFVDGASDAQVFLRIMLPQERPGIIAVAIIRASMSGTIISTRICSCRTKSKMTLAVGTITWCRSSPTPPTGPSCSPP